MRPFNTKFIIAWFECTVKLVWNINLQFFHISFNSGDILTFMILTASYPGAGVFAGNHCRGKQYAQGVMGRLHVAGERLADLVRFLATKFVFLHLAIFRRFCSKFRIFFNFGDLSKCLSLLWTFNSRFYSLIGSFGWPLNQRYSKMSTLEDVNKAVEGLSLQGMKIMLLFLHLWCLVWLPISHFCLFILKKPQQNVSESDALDD